MMKDLVAVIVGAAVKVVIEKINGRLGKKKHHRKFELSSGVALNRKNILESTNEIIS